MRVSDAEWKVLRVLWEHPDITAAELTRRVQATIPWKPTTVTTLLARLVKKKVVGLRPEIGGYRYAPLVAQAECEAVERRSFLEKVYGGRVKPLLAALVNDETLTPDEIAELRRLLDERR